MNGKLSENDKYGKKRKMLNRQICVIPTGWTFGHPPDKWKSIYTFRSSTFTSGFTAIIAQMMGKRESKGNRDRRGKKEEVRYVSRYIVN